MSVMRIGWVVVMALVATSCGFNDAPQEEPLVVHVPWYDAVEEQRPDAPPAEVEVEEPAPAPQQPTPGYPEHCAEPSWLGAPLLDDAQPAPGPTITERFGQDGCVAERHTFRYDVQGRVVEQTYIIFDPSLYYNTYVRPVSFHQTHEYDAAGNLTALERHALDPATRDTGELLYAEATEYDARGRKISQRREGHHIDYPSNGVSSERWEYHASGELALREVLYNGERSEYEEFERDAQGRALSRWALSYIYPRVEVRLTDRWTRDSAGNIVEHVTTGADGQQASRALLTYRADGTLAAKVARDLNLSRTDRWTYDGQGRQTRYEQDSDDDGLADYVTEAVYDARGNVVEEVTRYDRDPRGFRTTNRITRSFDAAGRQTEHRSEYQLPNGGVTISATTWSWDAQGGALRAHTNAAHDAPARRTSLAYVRVINAEEVALWEEHYDAEGAVSIRMERELDAQDQLVRYKQQYANYSAERVYSYDAAGRLVSERLIGPANDGQPATREERRYR